MSGYVSVELREQIREHFANCCAYCQTAEALTVSIFEVDHIVPRSASGKTEFRNLCLSCPTCNRFKASRTAVVSSDGTGEIELFHPHRDVWENHFAWDRNATRLIGLSSTGQITIAALRMNRSQTVGIRALWVAAGRHPPNRV